jgi:hypothetical protein
MDPVPQPPQPSTDAALCRVYGYYATADRKPAVGAVFTFTLVSPGLTLSERGIVGRTVAVKTDATGALSTGENRPFVELHRNDQLQPAGSWWEVACGGLEVTGKRVVLATATLDLNEALRTAT